MTLREIRQQLDSVLTKLSPEQARQVLAYADALGNSEAAPADEWEHGLMEAEDFWFSQPSPVRQSYAGQVVAVGLGRILGAGRSIAELRQRITAQFPDVPVLYIEAEAEREPLLRVRSPRLS